jgi:hypothetical protein
MTELVILRMAELAASVSNTWGSHDKRHHCINRVRPAQDSFLTGLQINGLNAADFAHTHTAC